MTTLIATALLVDSVTSPDDVCVQTHWNLPVDRPTTSGIVLRRNQASLIARLKHAIDDQRVWSGAEIKTDTGGQTYVAASCAVMGRTLNADLKRLGY